VNVVWDTVDAADTGVLMIGTAGLTKARTVLEGGGGVAFEAGLLVAVAVTISAAFERVILVVVANWVVAFDRKDG